LSFSELAVFEEQKFYCRYKIWEPEQIQPESAQDLVQSDNPVHITASLMLSTQQLKKHIWYSQYPWFAVFDMSNMPVLL
jgi:hypothetical protein